MHLNVDTQIQMFAIVSMETMLFYLWTERDETNAWQSVRRICIFHLGTKRIKIR